MSTNWSRTSSTLGEFMMEDKHDGLTLERYLYKHPQFAGELIDFSRLAAAPDEEDGDPLSTTDQSRIDAAWNAHEQSVP